MNEVKHYRIEIRYNKNPPYLACKDCSFYDDKNFLLDWDEETPVPNFQQKVKEALEKHNEELNEI
jgi:hypothetical protein